MTSSSEFHETEASEEYFGSRTSRESERADPTFDPISAFYAPKPTEEFEATSETQKNAQKSLMIDNLLNIRQECSLPDIK